MDIGKVIALLESSNEDAKHALLDDDGTIFWIDWRQEDHTIAESCESVLQTGHLSGETVEVDTDEGFEVHLQYKDRRIKVPLSFSEQDRHITLCALNRLLDADYEVRFCIDSNGSDTLAFLPLPCEQWAALEQRSGEAVARHFHKLSERPNVFTDPLPY